jgi:hypothetical protein
MKRKATPETPADVRAEYPSEFFDGMKPNRFAGVKKIYKQTPVMLDEDVSKVFQSSADVNTVLRSAIRAMQTAAPKPTRAKPAATKRRAS